MALEEAEQQAVAEAARTESAARRARRRQDRRAKRAAAAAAVAAASGSPRLTEDEELEESLLLQQRNAAGGSGRKVCYLPLLGLHCHAQSCSNGTTTADTGHLGESARLQALLPLLTQSSGPTGQITIRMGRGRWWSGVQG